MKSGLFRTFFFNRTPTATFSSECISLDEEILPPSTETEQTPYHLLAQKIRRFGTCTSIAILDPTCHIFECDEIEGLIGYKIKFGCAIVFGDPLCEKNNRLKLALAFQEFCKTHNKKVVYTAVSSEFFDLIKTICPIGFECSEELVLDPQKNATQGSHARKLRNHIKVAQKAGIEIHEYVGNDPLLESTLETVAHQWLQDRRGAQIYLANVDLFAYREGKRYLYACQGERVLGVLQLNALEAKGGFLLNLLMTLKEAPHGTSDFLVSTSIKLLREEGCSFLSFGVVGAKELGQTSGCGNLSQYMMRTAYTYAKKLFHLDTRRNYWKKFQPEGKPSFVLLSRLGIREVLALIVCLNAKIKIK